MKEKKYIKCWCVLFFSMFFSLNTLSAYSNLENANKYYDADDYPNAVEYFKKTLFEDKQYDGTVFYRYAYSLEQEGESSPKVYSQFYSAASYLFEKTNTTDNKYYAYSIAKEEKLKVTHKSFSDETIEDLINGKNVKNKEFIQSFVDFFYELLLSGAEKLTEGWLIFYCIITVCMYIVGRIFSKKTECVILSSIPEIILIFLPLLFIILLFIFELMKIEMDETVVVFTFIISFLISFISSIGFSIYENKETRLPVLYIIVSLVTKLALSVIAPLILFLTACVMKTPKKDLRYRDGTKGNQETKNIVFLLGVLTGIVLSLIKSPARRHKRVYEVENW